MRQTILHFSPLHNRCRPQRLSGREGVCRIFQGYISVGIGVWMGCIRGVVWRVSVLGFDHGCGERARPRGGGLGMMGLGWCGGSSGKGHCLGITTHSRLESHPGQYNPGQNCHLHNSTSWSLNNVSMKRENWTKDIVSNDLVQKSYLVQLNKLAKLS